MTDRRELLEDWSDCWTYNEGRDWLPGGCPHYALRREIVHRGWDRWKARQNEARSLEEAFFAGAHYGQFAARNRLPDPVGEGGIG